MTNRQRIEILYRNIKNVQMNFKCILCDVFYGHDYMLYNTFMLVTSLRINIHTVIWMNMKNVFFESSRINFYLFNQVRVWAYYIREQNYDTSVQYIEVNRNRRLFWKVRYNINLNRDTVFKSTLFFSYASVDVLYSEDIEITKIVDIVEIRFFLVKI